VDLGEGPNAVCWLSLGQRPPKKALWVLANGDRFAIGWKWGNVAFKGRGDGGVHSGNKFLNKELNGEGGLGKYTRRLGLAHRQGEIVKPTGRVAGEKDHPQNKPLGARTGFKNGKVWSPKGVNSEQNRQGEKEKSVAHRDWGGDSPKEGTLEGAALTFMNGGP